MIVLMAYLAGLGTLPTIGLFRYQRVVELMRRRPAPPPVADPGAAAAAGAVTAAHGYDTMTLITAGYEAGRHPAAVPTRKARPGDRIPDGWEIVFQTPPAAQRILPAAAAAPNLAGAVWTPLAGEQGGYPREPGDAR